jgi:hypothetical protein
MESAFWFGFGIVMVAVLPWFQRQAERARLPLVALELDEPRPGA